MADRPEDASLAATRTNDMLQTGDEPRPLDGPDASDSAPLPAVQMPGSALRALIAFLIYLGATILLWGLPLIGHLSTRYMAMDRELGDPDYYRWALGWTPWALSHGHWPLTTDRVFAPLGTSLTWSALIPGPAIVAWPLTRVFGSLVSYNVLMLAAPPLAAWATYLLCVRLTRSFWPSFAGGCLFALSAYMTGQMQHNLVLVLIFPVPLVAYLVVRSIEGSIGTRAFVVLTSLTLLGLFLISTELFATTALFGGLAFCVAIVAAREDRRRVVRVAALTAVSYMIVGVVLYQPYLVPAFRNVPAQGVRNLSGTSVDLLGFIVPRYTALIGGSTFAGLTDRFTANVTSDASYFSLAGLAVLVGFGITERRRRATVSLLAFVLITALLALGPVLHIAGKRHIGDWRSIPLPGVALEKLPFFKNAVPERFPAYAALAFAVIAALWLSRAGGRNVWIRWTLVLATAVMLLPNVTTPPWHFPDRTPAFFTDGTFASVLHPSETVYVISGSKGEGMAWQEVADYAFTMAGGYVGPVKIFNRGESLNAGLHAGGRHMPTPSHLAAYLPCYGVTAVVLSDLARSEFEGLLLAVGLEPVYEGGGVSIWRFSAPAGTGPPLVVPDQLPVCPTSVQTPP
jgi:hypothetical protein